MGHNLQHWSAAPSSVCAQFPTNLSQFSVIH